MYIDLYCIKTFPLYSFYIIKNFINFCTNVNFVVFTNVPQLGVMNVTLGEGEGRVWGNSNSFILFL